MPNKQTDPRTLAHHVEITYLVRAYGITRDQARRLIGRIGKNRAKLGEAARILKARLPLRSLKKKVCVKRDRGLTPNVLARIVWYSRPGRFAAVPRMGDERLERSWHWMSFLSHVASAAHSSLTSTSRRKQERRCDLWHSCRPGLINLLLRSCGICPV